MKKLSGSFFVILAGLFWGTMSIFVRALNQFGFSPIQITAIRFSVGVFFLALFILLFDKKCFKIEPKSIWSFVLLGFVSCFCMGFFYFASVVLIPVSVASVILYTAPIWVLITSVIFFGEKLTTKKIIALIVATAGCVLVSGFSSTGVTLTGIIYALLASFAYASYSIIGKVVTKKYSPLTVTLYSYIFAAVFAMIFCNIIGTTSIVVSNFSLKLLLLMIGLGVITISIPFTLYTIGLSKIPAGKAAIMSLTEPMVTTIVGVIVFSETIGILGIIGILAIISAIVLINT